jgi:hemoglobin-like flavoprotein
MQDDRQFYQILVDGQLDPNWSSWFSGLIITWPTGATGASTARQTLLSGYVPDQAALYGILNKLRDLNLTLVAVTRSTLPQSAVKLAERVSAEQITLVQHSFAQLGGQAEQIASLFYTRLFDLAPSLLPLFRGERQEQERKFTVMLVALVHGLPHLDTLLPVVQGLGRRHADYGVQANHYALVETALVGALAQGLGAAFTPAVAAAWRAAYQALAAVMQEE